MNIAHHLDMVVSTSYSYKSVLVLPPKEIDLVWIVDENNYTVVDVLVHHLVHWFFAYGEILSSQQQ